MGHIYLEKSSLLTWLHPDYEKVIFKIKLDMIDIKANFKRLYPSNLLRSFCNVVNKDFHIFSIANLGQLV